MDEEEDEYELTPEQEAEIEEIVAEFRAEAWSRPAVDEEEEETEFPQYQVQVRLIDQYAVP
jgi:hypothetical protein